MSTTTYVQASSRRGRPVLGGIAGFLLGLCVWVDLVLLDVIAFESVTFWIFPVLGVALGVGLAMWAPFGSGPAGAAPVAHTGSASTDATTPPAGLGDVEVDPGDGGGSDGAD